MQYIIVFTIVIFIGGVLIVLKMLAGSPQIDELEAMHPQASGADVDALLSQVKNNYVHTEKPVIDEREAGVDNDQGKEAPLP